MVYLLKIVIFHSLSSIYGNLNQCHDSTNQPVGKALGILDDSVDRTELQNSHLKWSNRKQYTGWIWLVVLTPLKNMPVGIEDALISCTKWNAKRTSFHRTYATSPVKQLVSLVFDSPVFVLPLVLRHMGVSENEFPHCWGCSSCFQWKWQSWSSKQIHISQESRKFRLFWDRYPLQFPSFQWLPVRSL